MIVTILAFIVLGGGSALAAATLGKNTVGSRQLKAKGVTSGKIAPTAINGSLVANGSLTGEDITERLGRRSLRRQRQYLGAAAWTAGTTLIRALDMTPIQTAEPQMCRPPPMPAPPRAATCRVPYSSTRSGECSTSTPGSAPDKQFTDYFHYDAATGSNPSTVTVDATGAIAQQSATNSADYTYAYPLVR